MTERSSAGPDPAHPTAWRDTPAIDRVAKLREELARRVLILDGGMGTMIQAHRLSEEDTAGSASKITLTRSWAPAITRPDVLAEIHRAYLDAGADIIETNTFVATRISLVDYGLQDAAQEINRAAATLARRAADEAAERTGKPRWVAGSIGPTNRTASISPDVNDPGGRNVTFDELVEAYRTRQQAYSTAARTCCSWRQCSTRSTPKLRSTR